MHEQRDQIRARFKRLPFVVGWTALMVLLAAFFSVVWAKQNGMASALIFAAIALLFIVSYGGMLITGASDVVLSEQGISRQLIGVTWKKIQWTNVSKVVVFFVPDSRRGGLQKAYNVFPRNKPNQRLLPSGKIAFVGSAINMDSLLDGMNFYLSKYKITIESVTSEATKIVDRL